MALPQVYYSGAGCTSASRKAGHEPHSSHLSRKHSTNVQQHWVLAVRCKMLGLTALFPCLNSSLHPHKALLHGPPVQQCICPTIWALVSTYTQLPPWGDCAAILCLQEQALPANNPSRWVLQCCVWRDRSKRRHTKHEEKPAKQKDAALRWDTLQPFPAGSSS